VKEQLAIERREALNRFRELLSPHFEPVRCSQTDTPCGVAPAAEAARSSARAAARMLRSP
jgi:hypothetical protein